VNLDVDAGAEPQPAPPESETPFRILLLGDFSGRANRGEPPPARLRPYLIDRDNFDQVLARMRPELELGPRGRGMLLRFREMEDFHPDRIYLDPVFEKLREARRSPGAAQAAPTPPRRPDVMPLSYGSLLDDVLDASETQPVQPAHPPDALRAFIDRAVAPHLVPRPDPGLAVLAAEADAAAGKLMRALLHHPNFQALEAAWRAVYWLVRGLETGPRLKVYLLDLSKADLPECLHELHRILVEQGAGAPGAEPWSLVAGNLTFARTASDIHLLGELARIMRAAGAPFLAEADLPEAGSPEDSQRWLAFRHSPEASWIGLALPRFLLRLPYGKETDTVESFPFEEMPGTPDHTKYLWGNPAFACACLIGQAGGPGPYQEIRGLPLHVYEADGERQLKPCAEVLMTEREAELILEQGFMPLVSLKDQDAIRLLRFQSIADPPARLPGRWN
jgi:type VI secretion system protein ImpC